ncbi:MAG: four helix bundle protein [Bacteroidetes bacterium]|nr:four helix bundle protein [Bacteroidota bacterium]MBS1540031.1 four helix bundle protein [Bacteroidota bacterium]
MPFKFEKLEVWKESVELSYAVHQLTLSFPKDELYVLIAQLKRAADSVSLNIAEGSTGQSNAEFRKFLGYSIRSGIEVIGCIYLAKKRSLLGDSDFNKVYAQTDLMVKRIQALRKSILNQTDSGRLTVNS